MCFAGLMLTVGCLCVVVFCPCRCILGEAGKTPAAAALAAASSQRFNVEKLGPGYLVMYYVARSDITSPCGPRVLCLRRQGPKNRPFEKKTDTSTVADVAV